LAALATVLVVAAAACSGSGNGEARRVEVRPGGSKPPAAPQRIVQLGDSIASGEGTLYGYTYDTSSREWTGGNLNAQWPPPYPECHVSPDAYGNKVARAFGATFTQFACTGASFDLGIAAAEVSDGTTYRPAQFGNWSTQQNLNADYDAADPDLVIVTLGADDVDFSQIVEDCVKNGYKHYWHLASLQCVESNPGPSVKQHFLDEIPKVQKDYGTLVSWIEDRAQKNNRPVPKILFTNYANPLPNAQVECPDTSYFYDAQTEYLASLLAQMNQMRRPPVVQRRSLGVRDVDLPLHRPVQLLQQGALPPDAGRSDRDRRRCHRGRDRPLRRATPGRHDDDQLHAGDHGADDIRTEHVDDHGSIEHHVDNRIDVDHDLDDRAVVSFSAR
jgi:hypothetical protein